MTTKTKILIGISVIGIVLIGGWWVWSPQIYAGAQEVIIITDKTEYKQGEEIKITTKNNLNKSIWYIHAKPYPWWKPEKEKNKTWKSLNVLLPITTEFGEECIAPPPPLSIEEISYELKADSEINANWNQRKCNGTITFIEPGTYRFLLNYGLNKDSTNEKIIYSNEFTIKERSASRVIVTTDKTEYKQVETIKITLKNNLKESIFSHIGSGTPIFCIEYIERKTTKGNWEKLLAQGQYPYVFSEKPRDIPKEIKPGQSEIFEWKPLIYINGTSESVQAGSGIYRITISWQMRRDADSKKWVWNEAKTNEFSISR